MRNKINVLVVDDSAFSRQSIKDMLSGENDIEVIGIASNGIEAMTKTVRLRPDVITLDLEMPEMDGFSFLRWLMKERPTPVIIVSSYSDSKTLFKALELGAVDFIAKPSRKATMELKNIRNDLLDKIRGIQDLKLEKLVVRTELISKAPGIVDIGWDARKDDSRCMIEAVAIGASTGGPAALQIILTSLPANFPAAILITQHMPKGFTTTFAERLNRISPLQVKEAEDGDIVRSGTALICPGGYHMTVRKRNNSVRVFLKEPGLDDRYIPSVDMLLSSSAEVYGASTIGVILTGMGNDGKEGIVEIKRKGGYTIAEAESTAIIFGMPQEAIKTGGVDRVLPLDEIPREITRMVTGRKEEAWKRNRA
jgi:two-component system chemotaxis response regulator CheB